MVTSFHEHLEAAAGFHLNWRAAFSGRLTTLVHLSANTRLRMLAEIGDLGTFPGAAGLVFNPFSIPTAFGTALPMMIHNHRSAARLGIESSHICLASPYLYAFRPNLDDVVAAHDCGLPSDTYPMNSSWLWHDKAVADSRLAALAHHLGVPLRIGRADGIFLSRALFDDMLAILGRFFTAAEIASLDPIYPLEEIVFPTMLPAILGSGARIAPTRAKVWLPQDPPDPGKIGRAIASGLHTSGKRIPQLPGTPVRKAVLANLPGEAALYRALGTTDA